MNKYVTIVVFKMDKKIRVVNFYSPYGESWDFDLNTLSDSISSYIENIQNTNLDKLIADVSESMGLRYFYSGADFLIDI